MTSKLGGPFGAAAEYLFSLGLSPIPVRDKVPLVKNWNRRHGQKTIRDWVQRFPAADIGVVVGEPSNLVVIDLDTADQLDAAEEIFGWSPLVVETRRGHHIYFLWSGEYTSTLQRYGLVGDMKAATRSADGQGRGRGGFVVVPPSFGRRFIRGGWSDFDQLAEMIPAASSEVRPPILPAPEGARNNALFLHGLDEVEHCDTFENLLEVLRHFNDCQLGGPETESKVEATARSVWARRGASNWRANGGGGVSISHRETERLLGHGRTGVDALALWMIIMRMHGFRRGGSFALAANAMARESVIPGWGRDRYRKARDVLALEGFIELVSDSAPTIDSTGVIVGSTPKKWRIASGRREARHNIRIHPPLTGLG